MTLSLLVYTLLSLWVQIIMGWETTLLLAIFRGYKAEKEGGIVRSLLAPYKYLYSSSKNSDKNLPSVLNSIFNAVFFTILSFLALYGFLVGSLREGWDNISIIQKLIFWMLIMSYAFFTCTGVVMRLESNQPNQRNNISPFI